MIDGDDDEVLEAGTEGEGTEGQDEGGGQPEAQLSAEHTDDEADDGEPEVVAEPKPSRAEQRFQRLANETRAAKDEAAAVRREMEDLRRTTAAQSNQQTAQQEREMLALMTEGERADYRLKQFETQHARERQQDRFAIQSMLDKSTFDSKAAVNPVYAKFKDTIEEKFQEQMRKGQPVDRETLLKFHLGELALQGAKNPKARKQGQERVASQRVSSGSGKGDAAADRGKAGDTAAKRLEGVYI